MNLPNAWVVSAEQDLVTVGRACLPARQGFTALDLLVLFHQVWYIPTASVGGTSRRVGGKGTTILPIKWETNTRVPGKESEKVLGAET
jgi:hypothetical protein